MPLPSRKQVVKASAAAALVSLTLCPALQAATPGFYFPSQEAPAIHPEPAPFAGRHNYGAHTHTFRWGWFGAEHFYPTNRSHRGTGGDMMRWSRWRRY